MSRPQRPALPVRDGVSASCVALPSGPWASVLDFLAERIPTVSHADWLERLQAGDVLTACGQAVAPQAPYASYQRQHGRLFYWRHLPFEHPIAFAEGIVYQDDLIVVADKPHFLPVTPKGRYVRETLLVRLKHRLGLDTLAPMHRLDRETAGLVAFTVQPHTRDAYQRLFRDRLVHKTYEAVAPWNPHLPWPCTRNSRLVEGPHFMTMVEQEGPVNAQTHIDVIEHNQTHARYRLTPTTGQRHQLRVHMNAMGLPIVNDQIYPVLQATPSEGTPPCFSSPLQLLAKQLAFTDPLTGQERHFESTRSLTL